MQRLVNYMASLFLLLACMATAVPSAYSADKCPFGVKPPFPKGCNSGNISGKANRDTMLKHLFSGEGLVDRRFMNLHDINRFELNQSSTAVTDPEALPVKSGSGKGSPGQPGSPPNKPFSPPGDGGDDNGGGGDDDGGNCNLTAENPCPVRGDEVTVASGNTSVNQCGLTVQLAYDWITTVRNQNGAVIVKKGAYELDAYQRSGNDLRHMETSTIPSFYCYIVPGIPTIENPNPPYEVKRKIIVPDEQYQAIRNSSRAAYIAVRDEDGGAISGNIIMKRIGTGYQFKAPPPDLETFAGASGDKTDCRSYNQLFAPLPPDFEGITMTGDLNKTALCEVETFNVDPTEHPQCTSMVHYYAKPSMYFYPGSPIITGRVYGGNADGQALFVSQSGAFAPNTLGDLIYKGSAAYLENGGKFYISIGPNVEDYVFNSPVTLNHPSGYSAESNYPGRLRVFTNGQVRFLDGGEILDSNGTVIRVIAPNAAVQFDVNQAISGLLHDTVIFDPSNLIPTAKNTTTSGLIEVREPFDTTQCQN